MDAVSVLNDILWYTGAAWWACVIGGAALFAWLSPPPRQRASRGMVARDWNDFPAGNGEGEL